MNYTSSQFATAQQTNSNILNLSLLLESFVYTIFTVIGSVVLLGIPMNVTTIYVFLRLRHGVGKSARVYYIALAGSELVVVCWYHVIGLLISNGIAKQLRMLTTLNLNTSNLYVCKLARAVWFVAEHSVNWLYVAFSAEKLMSIQNPLMSRRQFTAKHALVICLMCVASGLPFGAIESVIISITGNLNTGLSSCSTTNNYPLLVTVERFVSAFVIFIVPTISTLTINGVIIRKLQRNTKMREELTKHNAHVTKESQAAVTVVLMSLLHCLFYTPAALLTILQSWYLTWNVLDYARFYFDLFVIASSFTGLAHLSNFILYFARIPVFRHFITCSS